MAPAKKWKNLAVNVSISVIASVLFVTVVELAARLKYVPQRFDYKWIFEYDKDKVFQLKKSTIGVFAGVLVVTNSHGFRDAEIPLQKPPNTIRILALGDSVTFGHRVEADTTYPECLERTLSQTSGRYRFDVINTAVPGNSTFQEYYDLKRGLKFKPDLVVLQFTLNDVVEPYQFFKRYGGEGKSYHAVEDLPYFDYLLSQHSAFYLFGKDLAKRIRHRTPSREELKRKAGERAIYAAENLITQPQNPKIREAWHECLNWLQAVVELCEDNDLECILMGTPFAFQLLLDKSRAYPQMALRAFAERNGVVFIDVLDALQDELRRTMTEEYNLPKDTPYAEIISAVARQDRTAVDRFRSRYMHDYDHFSEYGHSFVATLLRGAVVDILKRRGHQL